MSRIKVDAIESTSGVTKYLGQAYVSVNMVTTTSVNGSGNVSSVTDNGTGIFTANLSNALTDVNYAWGAGGRRNDTGNNTVDVLQRSDFAKTTTALQVLCLQGSWTPSDFPDVTLILTR